jgi:hypothetical protein
LWLEMFKSNLFYIFLTRLDASIIICNIPYSVLTSPLCNLFMKTNCIFVTLLNPNSPTSKYPSRLFCFE